MRYFVLDSPNSCHMMELSWMNFNKKKRKETTILISWHWVVSNSSDNTTGINYIYSSAIGSAQEHLVRLIISKINLCVGDICLNLVIYPKSQLFWNGTNPTVCTCYTYTFVNTVHDFLLLVWNKTGKYTYVSFDLGIEWKLCSWILCCAACIACGCW